MTIEFHNTGYGRRFFDAQLPQLINSIKELSANIEAFTNFARDELTLTNVKVGEQDIQEYIRREAHSILNRALSRVK